MTDGVPKPLIRLAGRPLIVHTLEALDAVGVERAVVVTGYREGDVRQELAAGPLAGFVSFVSNEVYMRQASSSLAAARSECGGEPFLLLMSDHAVDASLIQALREQGASNADGGCSVAADYGDRPDHYIDEATKLQVTPDGRVTGIGKKITGWQALDAGAFYCTPDVWEGLDAVGDDAQLSDVFGWLAARSRLFAADVTGGFWYDVDTDEDLRSAESLILAGAGRAPTLDRGGKPSP